MSVLIKNVTALNEHGVFAAGSDLLFDLDGIISFDKHQLAAAGSITLPSETVEVIDGTGLWLMPGMIDSHCHIGLFNDGLVQEGDDGNEATDPVTPQMRAIDGIFHEDRCFEEAAAGGITTAMTGPGSANVLSGRFALVKTAGRSIDEMVVISHSAMKAALGENPKRCHGHSKDRMPSTRMATAAVLRDSLQKAGWYNERKKAKPDEYEPDQRWEALAPVLDGSLIMKFHVHRTDDILTAVRIADEFGLRYTLDHCTEGYLIVGQLREIWLRGQADRLAGTGLAGRGRLEGIITGPLLTDRSKPELKRAELRNPAVLSEAGLPVAIMTDHPVIPIQHLPVSAAIAVREGMSERAALAAITSTAARLSGAGESIGVLKAGSCSDLVLLDGHPFDFRSKVTAVWIGGKKVYEGRWR